ncbi:MAG: Bug family tripartite tricarboxylate transporter substrate binding protein [Betaproteobacteria bacterium]
MNEKNTASSRRATLGAIAGVAALSALPGPVCAQSYPSRPIRLIVGFGPGSGNDIIARDLARPLGELLGQSVVVENRGGGGGSIGTEAVAKAAADGYTIGLGTSSQLVMNVGLYSKLAFDVERDLRAIGLIAYTPLALVASSNSPASLSDLIAFARANPGKLTYGSGGKGSISHIVGESFAKAAGVQITHVPYKGNGPALVDVASGHINLLFDGFVSAMPLQQQGKVRLLAVSGARRSAAAPEVPTFAEQGLSDYEAATWNNLYAPSATPDDVVARLNEALNKAVATPGVLSVIARGGGESLAPSSPAQAEQYGRQQRDRWVPFVRGLQISEN